MAIIECGKGHIFDTAQYAECPYCKNQTAMLDFSSAGGEGKTVAPAGVSFGSNVEDVGKTVAPAGFLKQQEDANKTVAVFQQQHNIDPVVGWLVCIEGNEKGKDYSLFARINTIGRSDRNDVCIKNDNTISKENHARLAYDPKHNNFQLIPGNNINNIYLNGEPVYVPVKLNAYDVIELGSSKTVFVSLCNDRFDWEVGLKKD